MGLLIPYVVEDTAKGERSMDIYSRLLADRIVFIGTEINDQVANNVIAQLIFLRAHEPKKAINIYINSPGGHIHSGLAIYDTMCYLECEINTYCIGMAASMASLLLAAGTEFLERLLEGAKAAPANPASPVLEALAAADADQLTPKQALELIYELKALAADRE